MVQRWGVDKDEGEEREGGKEGGMRERGWEGKLCVRIQGMIKNSH